MNSEVTMNIFWKNNICHTWSKAAHCVKSPCSIILCSKSHYQFDMHSCMLHTKLAICKREVIEQELWANAHKTRESL